MHYLHVCSFLGKDPPTKVSVSHSLGNLILGVLFACSWQWLPISSKLWIGPNYKTPVIYLIILFISLHSPNVILLSWDYVVLQTSCWMFIVVNHDLNFLVLRGIWYPCKRRYTIWWLTFFNIWIIQDYFADEIGVLSPSQLQVDELYAGEVYKISLNVALFFSWFISDLHKWSLILFFHFISFNNHFS